LPHRAPQVSADGLDPADLSQGDPEVHERSTVRWNAVAAALATAEEFAKDGYKPTVNTLKERLKYLLERSVAWRTACPTMTGKEPDDPKTGRPWPRAEWMETAWGLHDARVAFRKKAAVKEEGNEALKAEVAATTALAKAQRAAALAPSGKRKEALEALAAARNTAKELHKRRKTLESGVDSGAADGEDCDAPAPSSNGGGPSHVAAASDMAAAMREMNATAAKLFADASADASNGPYQLSQKKSAHQVISSLCALRLRPNMRLTSEWCGPRANMNNSIETASSGENLKRFGVRITSGSCKQAVSSSISAG
jgi:hypothetical protein